jgi:hypothetical protein
VRVYRLSLDEVKASRPKPLVRALWIAAVYAPLYYIVHVANERVWAPAAHARPSLASNLILTAVQTALFSCALVWLLERGVAAVEIHVDDDTISVRGQIVRRGQVRTVIERRGGVILSERGRLATLLFGGVWIPRQLPAYEHLKNLGKSWLRPDSESDADSTGTAG